MSKTSISEAVKQLLFGVAAGRCQYRGCNRLLNREDLGQRGKFSVFAHIIADEPGGPRGDIGQSAKLAKDISNLMLLCFNHHRLIDVDDVERHSVTVLRDMKSRHEERIRRLTELDDNHRTLLVLMAANIGTRKGLVDIDEARNAVLPMYAVDGATSIDLTRLRVLDGDRVAWDVGMKEIDEAIRQLHERMARENISHLSVFALAPIPLLIYLGRAIGDLAQADVYQRRRTAAGWSSLPVNGNKPTFTESREMARPSSRHVCLVFCISDDVDLELVKKEAPSGARYVLRIPEPMPDSVVAKEQLEDFRGVVRKLLLRIRRQHGGSATIHIFPALPNSLAVELGRALLPKSDPRMEIYDFNRRGGGWSHALTLGPSLPSARRSSRTAKRQMRPHDASSRKAAPARKRRRSS